MFYTIFDFPLGCIFLAKSGEGLSIAKFMKNRSQVEKELRFFKKEAIPLEYDKKKFHLEKELFYRYFKGKREDFTSLPLDFISGTPFQRKVWIETRKIPFGKTETYKSLALRLDNRGYRSVGQALSKNPLLIVIPCHRVVRTDGGLGGFSAGLKLKEYLLGLEREDISS